MLVVVLVFQQRIISLFVIISDVWCVPCAKKPQSTIDVFPCKACKQTSLITLVGGHP
jgi:hypothetical protein